MPQFQWYNMFPSSTADKKEDPSLTCNTNRLLITPVFTQCLLFGIRLCYHNCYCSSTRDAVILCVPYVTWVRLGFLLRYWPLGQVDFGGGLQISEQSQARQSFKISPITIYTPPNLFTPSASPASSAYNHVHLTSCIAPCHHKSRGYRVQWQSPRFWNRLRLSSIHFWAPRPSNSQYWTE